MEKDSPEMSPEQLTDVAKVRKNGRKVEMILDELDKIYKEVSDSDLT